MDRATKFRQYLYVPFAEKDAAKALGAKWDSVVKKWYVPPDMEPEPFEAWLPLWWEPEDEQWLFINAPLFVAESSTSCWSCQEMTPVIALAMELLDSHGGPDLTLLCNIEQLPPAPCELIRRHYPFFKTDFSKTQRNSYMMNHCRCGSRLGDFYLHGEPGGCFFPITPEDGMKIVLRALPRSGRIKVKADYTACSDDFIGPYAVRRPL